MANAEQIANCIETIWRFVRGDMPTSEFEQWVYLEPELEELLGTQLYLDVISADFSCDRQAYEIAKALKSFVQAVSDLQCQCITLADLTKVDMGDDSDLVFSTFDECARRGDPYWWLSAYRCNRCEQWWLVAQEERHYDVFILKRLSRTQRDLTVNDDLWPSDFDDCAKLPRVGTG